MKTLYTIGYEGADISAFLTTLGEVGVKRVADIRDVPISRKKGFSKNKLAEALSEVGISYAHFKPLGDPKEGREAMRSGDRAKFLSVFNEHVGREDAQDAMVELAEQAANSETVLLCYERDPKDCHRTIVASMMKERGLIEQFTHLGVKK
ncbi:DUF488 family protein [Qipengyuania sp. DGS5-3]|uniref:DUF488 domain-containing protein n=1 Tax=Qipengyuania sp. DGS5-3 TaxID=3349632 RepID=UPI0036D31DFE